MDVTNHPFAAKTHVKKWRCDVCQTRYFKTFDEACAHEETCQQPKEQQQPQQQHEEAKQTAPAHSFFAPRKPAATGKRSKSCAKQQKKDTTPQHCFFEPLSKKPKTSTKTPVIKIEESPTFKGEESKTTVIDILNQHQQQLQQQKQKRKEEADLQFLASVKKKKPKKQKLPQEPITVENAHDMANSLAAMIADDISSSSSKQPLAAFFSSKPSKELLAEQRQAEFQAKRRLERRKEIERQQKRQARTLPEPTTHAKQLSTNSSSSSSNLLPLAPRFPVPSHVVSSETCMPSRVQVVTPPGWNKPNASFDTTTTTAAAGRQETKKLISSPSALDSSSIEPEGGDDLMIQTALQDVLRPSSSTLNDDHNDGQLWVDKYANPLIGSSTLQAAQELQLWIQEWCQARQTAMNRMMERQRKLTTSKNNKKKKRRKTIYKPDDDLWEGDDDNNKLGNVFLLTGPPSSGKTSLVHYVAAKCRCPVLEINTTQARGGAALKNAIQEATQSCSSLDLIKRQYKKLDAFADSEEDDDEQGSSSLTVILIDEVDFLFDEHGDAAFWTALSSVAKTAKCPIFLTANTMPRQMKLLQSYQYLELEKPLPDECMTKLVQVCRQEGISTKPELDPEAVKAKLSRVAQVCDCDVRRMLHELQSFVHSTASTESKVSNMKAWKDASLACAPAKLPCLHSAKPVLVLAEQYSVVTVTGKNFGFLHRAKNEWNVVIGQRNCKAHVVDEETLLVLCPPYQDDGLMAAPISIRFANGLVLNGDRVETDERPGGSHLPGRQRLYVNYQFLEDEECTSSDDEECEFGGNNSSEEKRKKWTIDESAKKSIEQKGMMMWDTVAAAANTVQCNPPTTTSPKDRELLATLESLSDDAQRLSDAAILEDGQYGLPFLSGACMGFGFDMTDCNQGEDGKLKMHDKIRPPREDRLFDLGWKDNCYFFGDADTYVTHPATAHERRLINSEMAMSRGKWCSEMDSSSNDIVDECEDAGDLQEIVYRHTSVLSGDRFLPQQIASLVLSLPSLLRESAGEVLYRGDLANSSLLDRKRSKRVLELQVLASYMEALGYRKPQTEILTTFQDDHDVEFCLEVLPMLRRLAFLERDSERIEAGPAVDQSSRTTRNSFRKGRKHYFEKLGFQKKSEREVTASKVGESFAESFLIYNQINAEK